MPIFIIEHLEPFFSKWCMIEYRHISKIVGKSNLWFTNCKRPPKALFSLGIVKKESICNLLLKNAVVLDPESPTLLLPKDSFDYIIFGGILGDDPPQARTKVELSSKMSHKTRNLGKAQMSTNTAVLVAKKITDGTDFKNLNFQDELELEMAPGESVILPYRYLVENRKVILPDGLVDYLKRRRKF